MLAVSTYLVHKREIPFSSCTYYKYMVSTCIKSQVHGKYKYTVSTCTIVNSYYIYKIINTISDRKKINI